MPRHGVVALGKGMPFPTSCALFQDIWSALYPSNLSCSTTSQGRAASATQWSALNAILGCRTEQYGQMQLSCQSCHWQTDYYLSCGHRCCNQCQNHATTEWLQRQAAKRLPGEYLMVTFSLPRQLRQLTKANQKVIYSLLFQCAVSTLKSFGLNDKAFAAELAMTAVLHRFLLLQNLHTPHPCGKYPYKTIGLSPSRAYDCARRWRQQTA